MGDEEACWENERALEFWRVGVEVVEKVGNGRKGGSKIRRELTVENASFGIIFETSAYMLCALL